MIRYMVLVGEARMEALCVGVWGGLGSWWVRRGWRHSAPLCVCPQGWNFSTDHVSVVCGRCVSRQMLL